MWKHHGAPGKNNSKNKEKMSHFQNWNKEKLSKREEIEASTQDILKHLKLEDIRMLLHSIKKTLGGMQWFHTQPKHLLIVSVEDKHF